MHRRDFLLRAAAAAAASAVLPRSADGQSGRIAVPDTRAELTGRFEQILLGFLHNAHATSGDYTVCDFPGGTKLKGCCTPGGKTYTSVARMLPALAEFVAAKQPTPRGAPDLGAVLLSIYRTAFDPKHLDYWAEPTGSKPTQRTVESSLVAFALVRLGPDFVRQLSSEERARVNRWLASCTVVPERTNNHAWFTAVNQAARLKLSRTFPEFKGDEAWMIADLEAMEGLAANAADGWYSDDPKLTVYDYYNFWTFGNFPLFWARVAGDLYPEWRARLHARAREFLQNTPYFFGADGAVPLFGRSLIYRWALLSPLLLGYEQGVWPHSPGLLRRIVRQNFAWWWRLGAYDEQRGKLRETLSAEGTPGVSEPYIDNGHPYWAMQAFTFFALPANDPLWTVPEEPLPVERGDFRVRIAGPRMLLTGTKASGQVRWLQAKNTPRRDYYRDKYNKFTASSSFPFNVLTDAKEFAPFDETLVLRDPQTGACAARIFPDDGVLLEDGVRTSWRATLGGEVRVVSTIRLEGDFEFRSHVLTPAGARPPRRAIEVVEGSHALGLAADEKAVQQAAANWLALQSRAGARLVSWRIAGHEKTEVVSTFEPKQQARINLVHPRVAVMAMSRPWDGASELRVASLHYASPRPRPLPEIHAAAEELLRRWLA